jgi:hypothetical protein
MTKNKLFFAAEQSKASEHAARSGSLDLYGLQEHLILCRSQGKFSFNLKCTLDRVHSFVFARIVTTFTLSFIVLGVGYLLV